MPPKPPRENEWFVKLLDERFGRLHDRIDAMEENRERRDRDVNLMDTVNKAEIHAVKDRVMAVESQIVTFKTQIRAVQWIGGAAISILVAIGGIITWAVGIWSSIVSAAERAV